MKPKLVTFDVWGTLIRPHPEYRDARNKAIADEFSLNIELVSNAFAENKRFCDIAQSRYSTTISQNSQFEGIADNLGLDFSKAWNVKRLTLEKFAEFTPLFNFDLEKLHKFSIEQDFVMCIICNAGNIDGLTLGDLFPTKMFPQQSYSDIHNFTKPDVEILQTLASMYNLNTSEIIHVGDTQATDGEMCRRFGCQFIQITNNDSELFFTQDIWKQ